MDLIPTTFTTFVTALDAEVRIEDDLERLISQCQYLGAGCYRTVVQLNDEYVLKVPNGGIYASSSGLCINRSEVDRWYDVVEMGKAAYFLPPIAAAEDGQWTVFPVANMDWQYTDTADMLGTVRTSSRDCGVEDTHTGNFGVYQGRLVCTDYADNDAPWNQRNESVQYSDGGSVSDYCPCTACRHSRGEYSETCSEFESDRRPDRDDFAFFMDVCSCAECEVNREAFEEAVRLWEERNA